MTIKNLYPTVRPTLDLNFAQTEQLDPRITYSRSSSATYFDNTGLLRSAGTNQARFDHDPVTGESLGLLVEEARTNIVLWNRDLTNAAWTATNVTTVKDQTGVDGASNSASKITASANNGTILQAITSASAARFTTAYVKRLTGTGTVEMTQNGGTTWTALTVTSSWGRVSIPSATITNPSVGFRLTTSGDVIAVDYIQCETGSFSTSAIATTTATVTRAADVASMTASPYLYGTFFAKYKQQPPSGLNRQIFSVGNANSYNAFVCRTQSNDTVSIVLPGIVDLTTTTNTGTSGFNNVATARVLGNYAVCLNGGTVAKTSSTSDQTNNSVITFMYGATSGGHLARFTYYPVRLPDAILQTLTS